MVRQPTRSVRLTVDAEDAEATRWKHVRDYLAAQPEAPANEVWREVGGRKQDVLNIVRDLRDEP